MSRSSKPRQLDRRAILVLESPWELDNEDANRSSVLPFVEGIAKLAGGTDVFHANFYDKKSFSQALDCLSKIEFANAIIYVAAHGYGKEIGGVKIIEALVKIADRTKGKGISGVLLGSCFVGQNTTAMEVCVEGSQLRWAVGYSSATWWLESTLIDCSILSNMLNLEEDDFFEKESIIEALARAVDPFSPDYEIGEDEARNPAMLRESLQFVIQPRGQGKRAKLVNEEVFEELGWE